MVDRFIAGDMGGGVFGLAGTKPTFDVKTDTVPEHFNFDSRWKDGATVYRIGTAVADTSLTFGETLPEIPFVYHWRIFSSTLIMSGTYATNDSTFQPYTCKVNKTDIIFLNGAFDGPPGSTFGFIILRPVTNG